MEVKKISTTMIERIKLGFILIGILVIGWLILPVTLGILTAYIFSPLLRFIHKKLKMPLWLAAFLTELLMLAAVVALILLITNILIGTLPELKNSIQKIELVTTYQSDILATFQNEFVSFIDNVLGIIPTIFQNVMHNLVDFSIYLMTLYFGLFETGKSRIWFFIYIPSKFRKPIKKVFDEASQLFGYFLSVEVKLFLLTFCLLSIGLSLLGFTLPIGKAFIISIADSLPFLGIGIFLIPMALYFFFSGNPILSMSILLLFIFIQLTRQLAESMMWASTLHIRTVHAFIISATSLLVFGLPGIIFSPFLLLIAVKLREHSIFAPK